MNREDVALKFLCYKVVCIRGVLEFSPKEIPSLRSFLMFAVFGHD
jgi:hypothetical protein